MSEIRSEMEVEKEEPPVQDPSQPKNQAPVKEAVFTEQQQTLYKNFMQKPQFFVDPPLFYDEGLSSYRDNVDKALAPFTSTYQLFNQNYYLSSNLRVPKPNDSSPPPPYISATRRRYKEIGMQMKLNNLKFIGYTLYACMIESLNVFRDQQAMIEKIKRCNVLLNKKLEEFYQEAEIIKEDYLRIQVIMKLEKQIQQLEADSSEIFTKIREIQEFAEKNGKKKQENYMEE